MERIGDILERSSLNQGNLIQSKKINPNIGLELPEPTLEEKRETLRKRLGVASLDNTFENFKQMAGTEKVLAAFKELTQGKMNRPMLLCYGGVGNGKTHLCEATAIELYKQGIFCRVWTMAEIMRNLKRGMNDPLFPYHMLITRYCERPYLIIDDVGMGGSGSPWEFGQLEEIIAFRYRECLFTILSTNLDMEFDPAHPELLFMPERIVSRFQDPAVGRVVLNEGVDYRPKKKARK